MLPLVANNSIPTPPPVVNTLLPGTTIAHVPYDNVAPSFSNAEVNNNASNNNTPPSAHETEPVSAISVEEAFANYLGGSASPVPNVNAQATFLAQLIGQDITVPPETVGILVQYEKLDAYANVKYKPSNATKPESVPAGAFSRILQEGNPLPAVPAPVAAPAKAPIIIQLAPIQAAPAAAPAQPAPSKVAKVANAYAVSAGRIAANSSAVTELA